MFKSISLAVLLASAHAASALVTKRDFTGTGQLWVLQASGEQLADKNNRVGCLNLDGKIIKPSNWDLECGLFTKNPEYPNFMLSSRGKCTFTDATQPENTDSIYGHGDYGYHCASGLSTGPLDDSFYELGGYICHGDTNCFYDAKKIPAAGEQVDMWPFAWGSQQLGITPGHVELNMIWNSWS